MRPVQFTGDLYKSSQKRIGYLRSLVPGRPAAMTPSLDRQVAFVAIEAMNCWAGFSRALYLSTCRGAFRASRTRLHTSVALADDQAALRVACVRFKPHLANSSAAFTHREEPDWTDPNTLIILLREVGGSNAADVGAALSFQGRVLHDLPTLRNFYGHRAENTVAKARRIMVGYGLPSRLHPTEFCLAYEPGSTKSVIVNWLNELDLVQELLVS